MLYMVECDFDDPAQEDAWNEWYSGEKLDDLLSNPGFTATQRFQAVTPRKAEYLAVHSVRSTEVFTDPAYKATGGGRFGDWDPKLMTNWSRRLFDGVAESPPVAGDELLVVIDGDAPLPAGTDVTWLSGLDWETVSQYKNAVALDASISRRGLAVVPKARGREFDGIDGVAVFKPLTELKRKAS
jgi:hypothetical protein